MNGLKSHDSVISSDIWLSYGNWESSFMQQEQSELSLSKDFLTDPCATAKHSKIASKVEIRRTKDRIRKRILRAKETPLASAIRREKNRRRMAAARARKSMQKKILQCVQENTLNAEVVEEASKLNRMTFGPPEVVVDSLSQPNIVCHKDSLPKEECASVNPLLEREMQMHSNNLIFSQLQDFHPTGFQNEKINSKKTQFSEMLPIAVDNNKRVNCGTIARDTFYKPVMDATSSFQRKNKGSQIRNPASPNVQFLDEVISAKGNGKETFSDIQNNTNLTITELPPFQNGKLKMPSQVTVANQSSNVDNIHIYQSSAIQTVSTDQTSEALLLSSSQNHSKCRIRENGGQTDQVPVQNINALTVTSDKVTIPNSSGGVDCMGPRYRRNTSISIEMRRKRDRLRKQLARARESQLEKEIRREKNRRRMAEFRARHHFKKNKTQIASKNEAATTVESWNPLWEQQWILNEVTPINEENNSSNLVHTPVNSFLLPKERQTFVVPNHLESFMSNLSSLWKAGKLCDASISNGTTDIMIHKMVLAAVCPKILTELSKTPLDKFQKVTFPNTVCKEALTAFAEYMYSGVLDLDEIILAQLKIIAQRLDMKDFEQLCESHLQTLQLMAARMDPAVSNELQSATDLESAVGLQTQVTLPDNIAPIMKLVPVDGQNSDAWPNSASDISFSIANSTSTNEGMLKIKQELADSAINDNSSKTNVKKEPVTLEDKTLRHSSARETQSLLYNQPIQNQGSLPHVESLVSISPLCAKITKSHPISASLNSSLTKKVVSSKPTASNITLHRNSSPSTSSMSSNSSSSTSYSSSSIYSQTDNSQVNLLGNYISQTSDAALTTAASIASLTSTSDGCSTSQTMPIKLPSPLSFYNIT